MNKFRLWLLAHGIEFEGGKPGHVLEHRRHISIAINHRYFGIDVGLSLFHGVYTDELNIPHAQIAADEEARQREQKAGAV